MAVPIPNPPSSDTALSIERRLTWHAVAMIVGTCGAAAASRSAYLAVPAAISFVALWQCRAPSHAAPRSKVGLANGLTGARLAVLLLTTAWMPHLTASWVLAAFVFNVGMDVVDGYAARRLGEATPFGAVFDREVDALFVLVAYLYFYSIRDFGAWVLLPGLLPYLHRLVVAVLAVPIPAEHKERLAAPLAGVNFPLLLAAVAVPAHATMILGASITVVFGSFGASFWSLFRHAHPLPQ